MLSSKEIKIITNLRKNSRDNIKDIALKNNIPTSSLYDTLNRLEDSGLIAHKSHVKFEKIGFILRSFIMVKTDSKKRESLKNYLLMQKNVNTVYRTTPGYDFHFETVFRDQKEFEDFIEDLNEKNEIQKIDIQTVIDTIQHENFLTKEEHFL